MSAGHRGIPAGRRERRRGERPWALFAASLSPFALKVASLLDAHGLAYRWVPGEAGFVESLRTRLRVARVHSGAAPLTWPERDPLDVIGVHRERLPCIGECEDEDDEADGLSRFWRGLVRLSIYGPPEEKPEPVRSLEVVNPIKARLDDKQP